MCCSSCRTGACPICNPRLPAISAKVDFLHSITHPQPPAPLREEGIALISATDHASASAFPGMGAGAAQQARHTCAEVSLPTISLAKEMQSHKAAFSRAMSFSTKPRLMATGSSFMGLTPAKVSPGRSQTSSSIIRVTATLCNMCHLQMTIRIIQKS